MHIYISFLQLPYIMLLCIYIVSNPDTSMNYLEAKSSLLHDQPQIPVGMLAIEFAALLCVAALMVRFFA